MADTAPFQPDARYEKILELLDRAMRGDKEILGQIVRRGGFSKEELAPVQEYANRKWAAKAKTPSLSPQEMAEIQRGAGGAENAAPRSSEPSAPVDMGAQYAMFLRDDPKPGPTTPAPTKKPAPAKVAKPKPKPAEKMAEIAASTDEQKLGAGALKMLEGILDGGGGSGPASQPASAPAAEGPVPMPFTVQDPYGRAIDSPAQQLDSTDDMEEMHRRIQEGYRQKALLQERYKAAGTK